MRTSQVAAVLCGLLLAACGAEPDRAGAPAGAPTQASHALSFTASTADGADFDGTNLAGKPAVLWFWAPWCPTCRAQAPGVSSLAERYAGSLHVVGVGGLADPSDIRAYAREVDGFPQLLDADGEVWRHFGVTAQSTYVVLDADANVVAEGYLDDHVLADEVADLVD